MLQHNFIRLAPRTRRFVIQIYGDGENVFRVHQHSEDEVLFISAVLV